VPEGTGVSLESAIEGNDCRSGLTGKLELIEPGQDDAWEERIRDNTGFIGFFSITYEPFM
jgi:hypothetical protein